MQTNAIKKGTDPKLFKELDDLKIRTFLGEETLKACLGFLKSLPSKILTPELYIEYQEKKPACTFVWERPMSNKYSCKNASLHLSVLSYKIVYYGEVYLPSNINNRVERYRHVKFNGEKIPQEIIDILTLNFPEEDY